LKAETKESRIQQLFKRGEFVITGEVGPPRSHDGHEVADIALHNKDYCDAMNLTDNQTAIVRLSSIMSGVILLQNDVEPIIQVTCRDRNRIAIQSDLLGAASMGIKNVLCLTGDHQNGGDHPTAKNVYDLDSVTLIRVVDSLRKGKIFSGHEIKCEPPNFFIGCVENPFGDPFEFRAIRLEKKIDAGADFVQTQCILDMERFERFMEKVRERGLHERAYICAGLMPIKSAKMARYMQKNVAGMLVSDEICERLEKAGKEGVQQEAVNVVADQIKYIKEHVKGVAGVHVMAVAWEKIIPTIINKVEWAMPRPRVS